jgi:hypothetical protein
LVSIQLLSAFEQSAQIFLRPVVFASNDRF